MSGKTRENDACVQGSGDSSHSAEGHAVQSTHVIDVEPRKSLFGGIIVMFVTVLGMILIGVTLVGIELWWPNHRVMSNVACVGMALLCLALFFLALRRHAYGRVRSLCHKYANRSTEELVRIIVGGFRGPGMSVLATALADVLSQRREAGFVIRCCPRDERDAIEPVAFPFEPLVLDEADDATAAFRHALNSHDGHDSAGQTPADADEPESRFKREIRRRNKLAGISGSCIAFFWVTFVLLAVGLIIIGQIFGAAIIVALLVISFFAGSSSSRVLSNRDCWLLVPGGLLVRRSGWRSGGVSVHRYERSRAVLVVLRSRGTVWLSAVSDGRSLHFTSVTKDEVNVLLRCWLSPLAPLPIDRYSDFAGST
ncbi:MAG: hypothetical protein IH987_02400 [Planctomycetes bacterium]|nr:hypothetical protein [Planctomycetota bacterium]